MRSDGPGVLQFPFRSTLMAYWIIFFYVPAIIAIWVGRCYAN